MSTLWVLQPGVERHHVAPEKSRHYDTRGRDSAGILPRDQRFPRDARRQHVGLVPRLMQADFHDVEVGRSSASSTKH